MSLSPFGGTWPAEAQGGRCASMTDECASGHGTGQAGLLALERAVRVSRLRADEERLGLALADGFVGFAARGFLGKAAWTADAAASRAGAGTIEPSSVRVASLGRASRLMTYRVVQNGRDAYWAASLYVAEGDRWRLAYHDEVPVAAPYAPKAAAMAAARVGERGPNAADPVTARLLDHDRSLWAARAGRRADIVDDLLTPGFIFVNPVTEEPLDKAGAQATWASDACTLTGWDLREARGRMVAEGVGLLTYMGIGHGACDGVPIEPRWIADIQVEDAGTWRSAMLLETRVEVGHD